MRVPILAVALAFSLSAALAVFLAACVPIPHGNCERGRLVCVQ